MSSDEHSLPLTLHYPTKEMQDRTEETGGVMVHFENLKPH